MIVAIFTPRFQAMIASTFTPRLASNRETESFVILTIFLVFLSTTKTETVLFCWSQQRSSKLNWRPLSLTCWEMAIAHWRSSLMLTTTLEGDRPCIRGAATIVWVRWLRVFYCFFFVFFFWIRRFTLFFFLHWYFCSFLLFFTFDPLC